MVEFVKYLDDIKGKTVERAQFLYTDEAIFLMFQDGTALFVDTQKDHDGCPEMLIRGEDWLGMGEKLYLGLISEDQYDAWWSDQKGRRRSP